MIEYVNNTKPINYGLTSPGLQKIIGKVPSWLIRRGILCILLVLLSLTYVAWLIEIPNKVTVDLSLKTLNGPIYIKSPISGNNIKILLKNGSHVSRNQAIAFLDIAPDSAELLKAKNTLADLVSDKRTKRLVDVLGFKRLGGFQDEYERYKIQLQKPNLTQNETLKVLKDFQNALNKWISTYQLISPLDGKIIYLGVQHDNEQISQDDTLFSIIRSDYRVHGVLNIPEKHLSKIIAGQDIEVAFNKMDSRLAGKKKYQIFLQKPLYVHNNHFAIRIDLTSIYKEWETRDIFFPEIPEKAEITISKERLLFKFFPLLKSL
ncbi:hypothetical protein [Olivibacter jilunii]|uniref:hypothetical protein n=1 Tax=Olivibacter jilunii TaxID=985016 RepID=UPI003F18263B